MPAPLLLFFIFGACSIAASACAAVGYIFLAIACSFVGLVAFLLALTWRRG